MSVKAKNSAEKMPINIAKAVPQMDRIGFRLLYYFVAVAETLSFSEAAKKLNMSQPPLSLHIKELETLLDTRLFLRNTRVVKLTAAGDLLFTEIRKIQGQTEQTLQRTRQIGRGILGHMTIGIVGTAAWGDFLPQLRAFTTENENITWSLQELSPDQQIEALMHRHIDIGVWREITHTHLPEELQAKLIAKENLLVAFPKNHAFLRANKAVSLNRLKNEAFIGLTQNKHNLGSYLRDVLLAHAFNPRIEKRVAEPQTALALVGEGYGITLLPADYAKINWPNVHFCPLKEAITANLYAVTHQEARLPAVQHFLQTLQIKEIVLKPI